MSSIKLEIGIIVIRTQLQDRINSIYLNVNFIHRMSNDSFKVFIRCRPLNQKETSCFSNRKAVSIIEPASISLTDIDSRQTFYNYDGVFSEHVPTESIFEESVLPVITHFINGYNSTVFAYGITGAGKSYTMFGSQEHYGLIPLTINSILNTLTDQKWNLKMSYIQIYNEQIFDLFVEKSDNLQVIEDPDRGVIVMDVEERQIKTYQNAHQFIHEGNIRRVMAQTYANDSSSRSHAIILLNLERQVGDKIVTAKMSLVDLAGSEKATVYTGNNKGTNRLEGSNINKSLLALGNCIMILSENSKKGAFVPYRDSKLTRLLKDSLGGNTKTVMIACISQSPVCYDETLSTLKYAGRARKIQKTVIQNTREQSGNYQQLKVEYERMKKELEILKLSRAREAKDEKSKALKIESMLNSLVDTVREGFHVQVQNRSSEKRMQREEEIKQLMKEIVNVATDQDSLDTSAILDLKPNNYYHRQTRDKRSKTICKQLLQAKQAEPKLNFQLNSLNNVRNHRRRNSIMHSESMSNTLNFLHNYSILEESKAPQLPKHMMKSHSTLSVQQSSGRKSKHLNVLKQIQEMSKKLKGMSKQKKIYHNSSIQEGVDQENEYQHYEQLQVL